MVGIANNQFARLIGTCRPGHKIHITVLDAANSIFLAKTRNVLENLSGGVQPGIPLAKTNGPSEINWDGEIWVFGSAASVAYDYSIE